MQNNPRAQQAGPAVAPPTGDSQARFCGGDSGGHEDEVHDRQRRVSKEQANELSVRLELQAHFFAGVWAHHAEQNWRILEPGDVEKTLLAATAIGDDRLQVQSRGFVVPESFTHGTSQTLEDVGACGEELERRKEDLASMEKILNKLLMVLEQYDLELRSPERISLLQKATVVRFPTEDN